MKTLEWVLKHIYDLETTLDDRLIRRLYQFLTVEQMEELGLELEEESKKDWRPLEWTEENILKQLKDDVKFGIEKATHHRGISSSLMYEVCRGWCIILENGLEDTEYEWYGCGLFKAIDEKYEFGLVDSDTFDDDFYKEW